MKHGREGMMMRAKEILGTTVRSADGEIGKVKDILFDSEEWVVRYVVVDTWDWLPERKLIIPPAVLKSPATRLRSFDVPMDKREISRGATLRDGDVLTRRVEASVFEQFKLAPYWAVRVPGGGAMIADQVASHDDEGADAQTPLKSFRETAGFEILAGDGPIGRMVDFFVDDQSWSVAEVAVDTTDWLRDGSAVLKSRWFTGVDTRRRKMTLNKTSEEVENDPGFKPLPDRDAGDGGKPIVAP
ncbi:MAG: PRC-barrel domain-containing protein [Candidatus Latescibacterota bacterium]|jgi:hypothetical protein